MSAYFIVDQKGIHDPETMKTYSAGVAATVEQYGGKFLVRGGDPETIEGDWAAKRVIMIDYLFGDTDHHLERFIALGREEDAGA